MGKVKGGPLGPSLCGNSLWKKGWSHLTFSFFPAEGMHPFDCFLSSLPAEGLKLSLEKPTDVVGLRNGRRAPLGAPPWGRGGGSPLLSCPFLHYWLKECRGWGEGAA